MVAGDQFMEYATSVLLVVITTCAQFAKAKELTLSTEWLLSGTHKVIFYDRII